MEPARQRKPVLTLRKNIPTPAPTPIVEDQYPQDFSDLTQERFQEWDIPVVEDVEPKRRKRRKDKHIEQYRKEARWQ